MDYKFIGILVIGLILLSIVLAFIFSAKFRKDVIASEGEAAVLGLINVKGVIIVLLTAIFGGLFAYILNLDFGNESSDVPGNITVEQAIKRLAGAKSGEVKFQLEHHQGDDFLIEANGDSIGWAPVDHQVTKIEKSLWEEKTWDVFGVGEETIGRLTVDGEWTYKDFYAKDSHKEGEVDDYSIVRVGGEGRKYRTTKNSPLFFRIDSLNEKGTTKYWLSFAEKNNGGLVWKENEVDPHERLRIMKTPNGRFENLDQFTFLIDVNWQNFYLVGVGLGDPEHDDDGKFLRRVKFLVFKGSLKHKKDKSGS